MNRIRLLLPLLALLLAGCFSERSFPMVPERLARMPAGSRHSVREWTSRMHDLAIDRIPTAHHRQALTTDQLSTPEGTVNVWKQFRLNPAELDSIFGNLHGIEATAQVTSPSPLIENGHVMRAQWPGFRDVEVPVGNGAFLYGRLGAPDKEIAGSEAAEATRSFVILTHGLFGSLDGWDVINHAQALRRMGHHVLALEMRGHGETLCRHPEYGITFGVFETGDLIAADRWLRETHGARRVGLVCFSLTGYEALLTAWLNGKNAVSDFTTAPFLKDLPPHTAQPAFDAGMFVVSVPMGIVAVADGFEKRYTALEAPAKSRFQDRVAERLAAYKEPPGYSMWDLAHAEFRRSGLFNEPTRDADKADFLRFIDFSRDNWRSGAARLENIRVPVLILSAANDPLGSGQNVAELFSRQKNPNIGVVLLREGGHMGFTALSADYYYSMMMNFFDPKTAPVAQ